MQFHSLRTRIKAVLVSAAVYLSLAGTASAAEIPPGNSGFESHIKPFFKTYCVKCHGPEKRKGKVTLHDIDGDLATGNELERWELILDVLRAGEMPPEEEKSRPAKAEVVAVTQWIEVELRKAVAQAKEGTVAPQARRLTNFEYENTIRDLIGYRLKLTDNLPKDPEKPYHFNNTAEFMLLGPEQVDRYLENARQVMAKHGISTNNMYTFVKELIDMNKPAGHGADPFFFDRKPIHPPLREILCKYLGVVPVNLSKP